MLFPRGSEWRKWDLHVHSPASVLNNQFEGQTLDEKWERYFTALEGLDDIAVLGITDYFSVEGYKKVKEYQANGGLQNIALILPNVEMRIPPSTRSGRAINIHIIFSPDVVNLLDDAFFSRLTFNHRGEEYGCTRAELIRLGHRLDADCSDEGAYKTAVEQFKTTPDALGEILSRNETLRQNSLIVLPNGSTDGASGRQESQFGALRDGLYWFADLIFSGNPTDRDYFLGKGVDAPERVVQRYGSLKPCVHGSDAHCLEKICRPDLDRHTWIKADPTFSGLRQILFEPEARVCIQKDSPGGEFRKPFFARLALSDTKIFEGKPVHFKDDQDIVLNRDLVAIIGGRATGKSLLLDALAKTFKQWPSEGATNRAERITMDKGFEVEYRRPDESPINYRIGEDNNLRYLHVHQNEVQSVVSDPMNLDKEIKRLLGIGSQPQLDDGIHRVLDEIRRTREWLDRQDEEGRLIHSREHNRQVKREYEELISTITTESNQELVRRYRSNRSQASNLASETKRLIELRAQLVEAARAINLKIRSITRGYLGDMVDIPPVTMDEQFSAIRNAYETADQALQALRTDNQDIETEFREAGVEGDIATLLENVSSYQAEIAKCERNIEEIDAKEARLRELMDVRSTHMAKVRREMAAAEAAIGRRFCELKRGKPDWSDEQRGLVLRLLTDVDVAGVTLFDEDAFYGAISQHCLNMTRFRSTQTESSIERVKSTLNVTDVESYFGLVRNEPVILLDDANPMTLQQFVETDSFVRGGKERFLEVLFSSHSRKKYLKVVSQVCYQGKPPLELSTGQRGTLYLCLKLATDPFSTPFVFDQPEDDLDNSFIMENLVPIIRSIKEYRQVIIVTHNANIVVNADAEQVIVAQNDREELSYTTGSLEDPDIREAVCTILEGGKEAFRKRERKYALNS